MARKTSGFRCQSYPAGRRGILKTGTASANLRDYGILSTQRGEYGFDKVAGRKADRCCSAHSEKRGRFPLLKRNRVLGLCWEEDSASSSKYCCSYRQATLCPLRLKPSSPST